MLNFFYIIKQSNLTGPITYMEYFVRNDEIKSIEWREHNNSISILYGTHDKEIEGYVNKAAYHKMRKHFLNGYGDLVEIYSLPEQAEKISESFVQ